MQYLQQPVPDYVRATVDTILRIHAEEPPGDILAFLTGQEEVGVRACVCVCGGGCDVDEGF